MKKIYVTIIAVFAIIQFSYAQWSTGTDIHNTNTGNVGVGVTSPLAKFHVTGTFLVDPTGSNYNEGLRIHPSSANSNSSLILGAVSGATGTGVGQWTLLRYPSASSYLFGIRYNATDYFNITNTGYVGIGTNAPLVNLTVQGTDNLASMGVLSSSFSDVAGLGYNSAGSTSNGLSLYASNSFNYPGVTVWDNNTLAVGG